jgi:hypothetical protein
MSPCSNLRRPRALSFRTDDYLRCQCLRLLHPRLLLLLLRGTRPPHLLPGARVGCFRRLRLPLSQILPPLLGRVLRVAQLHVIAFANVVVGDLLPRARLRLALVGLLF